MSDIAEPLTNKNARRRVTDGVDCPGAPAPRELSNTGPTHPADHEAFNYYGRWRRGAVAVSINSGAMVEFAYTGHRCDLVFDVSGFTHYPAICVQVDNGTIAKSILSEAGFRVTVQPSHDGVFEGNLPAASVCSSCHWVRFWVVSHSLYNTPAAGRQWSTLAGGCRFLGAVLEDGAELIPLPYHRRQIEFLGDSLTQGLRLLYTGQDADTQQQIPYANWPQITADLLGMRPVVTGFGGQGLTTPGSCGAPAAEAAFPWVCEGMRYVPAVQPERVVIYQGTNDPVTAPEFQARYVSFLQTVRNAYPSALIFAICPHNQGRYAAAIRNAVALAADAGMRFLDYADGIISAQDTVDGCHLNPGGAARLGIRVASDMQKTSWP